MSQIEVAQKAEFGIIRYASAWEDADILCEALRPVAKKGRLLAIAASGDNALALLTLDPREVLAADLSPAQLALCELKREAFRRLPDQGLLAFLGVEPSASRLQDYPLLRPGLSVEARAWWDSRPEDIEGGVIHAGKFDRYLSFFGRRLIPLLQPGPWRKALVESDSPVQQKALYESRWNHALWRGFFKVFFSRWLMGRAGRDPAFLAQAEGDVAQMALDRVRVGFTATPARRNPYLQYVFNGNYSAQSLPLYLRPASRKLIRARLGRLKLWRGEIQEAGKGRFDGMVLSDIFEYMNTREHARVYARLLARGHRGARLAYWNLFVPRRCPLPKKARALSALAGKLHQKDKAWFYRSFELDQIL